jgi:hypothetical protein
MLVFFTSVVLWILLPGCSQPSKDIGEPIISQPAHTTDRSVNRDPNAFFLNGDCDALDPTSLFGRFDCRSYERSSHAAGERDYSVDERMGGR